MLDRLPPPMKRPQYDEVKATQAAALFLMLNRTSMPYMKLVKLLYNADREAILRWGSSITNDDIYCLPHGLILSATLDKAETSDPVQPGYWDQFICTRGYHAHLRQNADPSDLSEAEVELIGEIFSRHEHDTAFQMERQHHDPAKFPEWTNPRGSRILTPPEHILRATGHSEDQVRALEAALDEEARLEEFFSK